MRLDVEVVNNDIPLLISKGAMKQMGLTLDFSTDTVTLSNGKVIKLMCTSSGHYCLPLSQTLLDRCEVNVVLNLEPLKTSTREQKKKKALKLHKQFFTCNKREVVKVDCFKWKQRCSV